MFRPSYAHEVGGSLVLPLGLAFQAKSPPSLSQVISGDFLASDSVPLAPCLFLSACGPEKEAELDSASDTSWQLGDPGQLFAEPHHAHLQNETEIPGGSAQQTFW